MYARTLHKAEHTRRYTIARAASAGWEVRLEQDSQVIRRATYTDWHRVERARMMFVREASLLRDAGWTDQSMNC